MWEWSVLLWWRSNQGFTCKLFLSKFGDFATKFWWIIHEYNFLWHFTFFLDSELQVFLRKLVLVQTIENNFEPRSIIKDIFILNKEHRFKFKQTDGQNSWKKVDNSYYGFWYTLVILARALDLSVPTYLFPADFLCHLNWMRSIGNKLKPMGAFIKTI